MKIKIFLSLLFINSLSSKEFTINSLEETILSYPNIISVTNCSPAKLGVIERIEGVDPTKKSHILKFVPNGISGTTVCSAKTKYNGVISTLFRLRKWVKRPIIEIPLEISPYKIENISTFSNFIRGDISKLTKIWTKGEINTKKYRYIFLEKFQALSLTYLYKIKTIPLQKNDEFIRLDRNKISPILFSHYTSINHKETSGISGRETSYIYLMTNKSINLKKFKLLLR